jgi:predicted P-loop ATPase
MTLVNGGRLPNGTDADSETASKKSSKPIKSWRDNEPLDPRSFPNTERRSGSIPCTISNIEHLLKSYGLSVRYDVIRKRLLIDIPGWTGSPDNYDNVALAILVSLTEANNMATRGIEEQVLASADRNLFNPAADWILSKPWDGIHRLPAFYATLTTEEGFPVELKHALMYRWLLSIVAAACMARNFKARGVLTLQGAQGMGKTSWVSNLVPDPDVREMIVKLDHHLDPHDKDSVLSAISHLIVEVGELDSSFRKDVARLKGFITRDSDKVRRPYARTASEYPRRTVFVATVNDRNFLVDDTGNSRFWTLPLVAVDYAHRVDMQQLFAQLHADFVAGHQWWLTKEEEALLEASNRDHRSISSIREHLIEMIDLAYLNSDKTELMGTNEVLRKLGIQQPRNGQNKEVAATLRELLGEPRRINGNMKWRIPWRQGFTPLVTDQYL